MPALRSRALSRFAVAGIFLGLLLGLLMGGPGLPLMSAAAAEDGSGVEFFEKRIRPVLVERCYRCHSTKAAKAKQLKGQLRLDSRAAALAGGDSGPAVVPGDVDASLLIDAVRYESLEMPPSGKLPDSVIVDFVRWIEMGAPDPRTESQPIPTVSPAAQDGRSYWAFVPPRAVRPPAVSDAAWPIGAIDRFVLAKLDEAGLAPAPPIDRRGFLRRATYGLTGLPPTGPQLERFLADESPDAFAKVIDRLLRSPHFGVRWGRHWLDNVRYSEDDPTCGADSTNQFAAKPYRDWVVKALNEDMPYDQFVRWQIAGDLIAATDTTRINADALTATGLWGLARLPNENDANQVMADFVDDQLDVLGRTFMGLTLSCARCHDHKFDPISQPDYYALAGIFYSSHIVSFPSGSGRRKTRNQVPILHTIAELKEYEQQKRSLERQNKQLSELEKAHRKPLQLMKVRRELAEQLARQSKDEAESAEVRKKIDELRKTEKELLDDKGRAGWQENPPALADYPAQVQARDALQRTIAAVPLRMVMREGGAPGTRHEQIQDMRLFVRGNFAQQGEIVPRRFPEMLAPPDQPSLTAITPGSGRLELARWLTEPDHPLTARVMVNRIWQHLTGEGLVRTPSNFGKLGEPPTDAALLDFLARRFVQSGWSVKAMIREITLSRAYQQVSRASDESLRIDPENRLLSHMNRRRLDAESLRDTLLGLRRDVSSGSLPQTERSFYLRISRAEETPLLSLFDGADASMLVPRRSDSTAASQSLFMLNNRFVLETAEQLADEMLQRQEDQVKTIRRVYRRLFGRSPTHEEEELGTQILAQTRSARGQLDKPVEPPEGDSAPARRAAWIDYCHVLLCSNELLYLD